MLLASIIVGRGQDAANHPTMHSVDGPFPPFTTKNGSSETSIVLRSRNLDSCESVTNLTRICIQNTLDDLHVPFLLETTVEH